APRSPIISRAALIAHPYASEGTKPPHLRGLREIMERETGFEPATSTLARSHSTTELLPLESIDYSEAAEMRSNTRFSRSYRVVPWCSALGNGDQLVEPREVDVA